MKPVFILSTGSNGDDEPSLDFNWAVIWSIFAAATGSRFAFSLQPKSQKLVSLIGIDFLITIYFVQNLRICMKMIVAGVDKSIEEKTKGLGFLLSVTRRIFGDE